MLVNNRFLGRIENEMAYNTAIKHRHTPWRWYDIQSLYTGPQTGTDGNSYLVHRSYLFINEDTRLAYANITIFVPYNSSVTNLILYKNLPVVFVFLLNVIPTYHDNGLFQPCWVSFGEDLDGNQIKCSQWPYNKAMTININQVIPYMRLNTSSPIINTYSTYTFE